MSQHRRRAHDSGARRSSSDGSDPAGSDPRGYAERPGPGRSHGQPTGGGQYGGQYRGQYGGGQPGGYDRPGYGGRNGGNGAGEYGGYGRDGGPDHLGPSTRTYGRGGSGGVRPQTRAEARNAQGRAARRAAGSAGGAGGGPGGGAGKKRLINYPRAGRTGLRRWIPSGWQLAGLGMAGFIAMFGTAAVAYAMIQIPPANANVDNQTTIIYYDDGKTEIGRLFTEQRTKVELSEIKPHVQNAVLAAENRTFYTDSGISPKGIARAMWTNVRGGRTQGGSTITQQLAKNMYLSQERTVQRKFKEFFISIKLDQQREKKQILEDYLNTIYFGRGAYGIEAAAQAYFPRGTTATNLTLEQAVTLAAMIRGPRFYDPYQGDGNDERLAARFRFVLNGMVKMGAVTPQQAASLQVPKIKELTKANKYKGQAGYLIEDVKRELQAIDPERYSNDALNTEGYRIRTTFNRKAMDAAVKTVNEVTKREKISPKIRIGLAAVEPGTGKVLATYGGKDYLKNNLSNATQGTTQAGSTFKAFTLAAGLSRDEDPVALESRFDGNTPYRVPNDAPGVAPVRNEDDKDYGKLVSLIRATEKSINTAFVDATANEIGPKNVRDAALKAGIPERVTMDANARITLGIAAPRVIDMAHAYATFAANGVEARPYLVQEVKNSFNKPILTRKPKTKKAFDEDVISNVTWALEQVVENGTGRRAQELGRPAAGKTGTAQNNTSAWFVGYTPQVSTAVGLYRDNLKQTLREVNDGERIEGASYPTMIWTEFMKRYHEEMKLEIKPFPDRAELETEIVNPPPPEPKPTFTREPDLPTPTIPVPDPTFTRTPDPEPTFTFPPVPTPNPTPSDGLRCPPFCPSPEPDEPTPTDTKPGRPRR